MPFTVRVNDAPPAVAEDGDRPVMAGVGTPIKKLEGAEGLPLVLIAVMLALPEFAMRLADTAAVTWVALTKVVVSGAPFH